MAGFVNNVLFNPTLGGTADWVVDTAVQGYNTPASATPAAVNGQTYKYKAESADYSQWEIGYGVYTSGSTTLARTVVLANSLGTTAKINFGTVPQVGIIALADDYIEPTTAMLFYQASAPVGWTKVVTQNDKALRVVSGSGGVAGGTNAFSTVMAQTVVGNSTLSTAQLAAHKHQMFPGSDGAGGSTLQYPGIGSGVAQNNQTSSVGSGSTHNHTVTMDIQYVDIIIATKD